MVADNVGLMEINDYAEQLDYQLETHEMRTIQIWRRWKPQSLMKQSGIFVPAQTLEQWVDNPLIFMKGTLLTFIIHSYSV